MKIATLTLLFLTAFNRPAKAPESVFWVTMSCVDTTVPIRTTLDSKRANSGFARSFAEARALNVTVWTNREWAAAFNHQGAEDELKQITDFCRAKLAASWGYTKEKP